MGHDLVDDEMREELLKDSLFFNDLQYNFKHMYTFGKYAIERLQIDADKARLYDGEWVIWGEADFRA